MEVLIVSLIVINALLVAVTAYMSSVIGVLSNFRRRVMTRHVFSHRNVPTVRYRANVKLTEFDLRDSHFLEYVMRRQEHGEPSIIGYIHQCLIDAILDKVRDDLKKNRQTIFMDFRRDAYEYEFLGEMKFAVIPPDDDELDCIQQRLAADPAINPIISKHF